MKKFYILILAFFALVSTTDAQLILEDNFDSYALGDMLDQNTEVWGVWSGSNNGDENIEVSDAYASSGTQSGFIGPGQGPQDAILLLGNQTLPGIYHLSFNMYIPAGKTAYFNFQGTTSATGGAGNNGMGVFNSPNLVFNNDMSAGGMPGLGGAYPTVTDAEPAANYSWDYPEDTWFPIDFTFEIDSFSSDSSNWVMSINNVALPALIFVAEEVIGGIDFFAISPNNEYYIDDISFEKEEPIIIMSTNNVELEKVKVFPNPVFDALRIQSDIAVDEISVYNVLGELISYSSPKMISPEVDMRSFAKGTYLVQVRIGDGLKTFKVAK